MKKHPIAVAAIVMLLITACVAVTAAQTRPDFSGVWKPIDGATPAPPVPPPPPGGTGGAPLPPPPPKVLSIAITQSATELRIERRADDGGREVVYNFAYALDGTESVNQMGSILLKTKAAWDGDALVLSSTASVEGNSIGRVKDVYRFDKGQLIVETTRQTPSGTFTSRTAHRRAP